jgi:phage FluMu gp28-like protein
MSMDAGTGIITPAMQVLAQQIKYDFKGRVPAVLLPYQQKWLADTSRIKIIEKSRRIGLSWTSACGKTLTASSASGRDQWYIGYTKDMAIEFILDCAQWAVHFQSVADAIEIDEDVFIEGQEKKSVFAFSIRFASGHRITALSSQPRNLRGKQGDVVLDERAFHQDQAGLMKAAIALLIWGGSLEVISTHNGDDNEFNTDITDCRAGRKPFSLHRVTFDDALADGLYHRVCLRLGTVHTPEAQSKWAQEIRGFYGDDADEELDCVPKHGSGAFLTRELVERCMVQGWPVLRDTRAPEFTWKSEHTRNMAILDWCNEHLGPLLASLPTNEVSFVGADFARISDLTCFVPLLQRQNLTRYAPFVVELRGMPFAQQRQVLWYLIDRLPRFAGAALDSRGLGMQMAEETAQRYGGPEIILMIQATQPWYLENLPPYKAAFEDNMIQLPMDADILADHRVPRVIKGIPQVPDVRTADALKKKRHGDSFIAGANAWHASRLLAAPGSYGYEAPPSRMERWDAPANNRDDSDAIASQHGAW